MKTTFSRQFALTAGLILLSVLLLGVSFRVFLSSYVVRETQASLQSNAAAVSNLASAYDSSGELSSNWNFRISLSFAAQVADADAVVCDETGRVILCSQDTLYCEHIGLQIDQDYVDRVIANGSDSSVGVIQGLYDESRYLVAVPILSRGSEEAIGIVLVSTPQKQTSDLIAQTTDVFIFTAMLVILLALIAVSLLVRSQCQPLRDMAAAARRFGHGELDVRVATGGSNTEEIDELAVAFNNMADELEKSEQQRQEFVANVSHELKTPMTTIAGFMDGMLDGTIPPERHRQYMQTVANEVRRLSRLVRSMLDISRLQSQGIPDARKRVFDVCEQVGQVLITFEQRINRKQLQVEVDMPDEPVEVFAESDSITQVIYNLVDNAVKFCNQEGTLGLRVRRGEEKVFVSVSNTGLTIPENELSLIFDRFHKTDKSRSMDRDGVGLGLYIVRTIILSHGEDISVTSRDGVTEFTFTLPMPK